MQMSGMNPFGDAMGSPMYSRPMAAQETIRVEPWLYQRLKRIEGMRVVVDTVRGAVNGVLVDVKPDHIAVQEAPAQPPFFVRLCEVVWVMPNID